MYLTTSIETYTFEDATSVDGDLFFFIFMGVKADMNL